MRLKKCPKCGRYTLRDVCPICGHSTVSGHPPRFSPEDRWRKYRIQMKKAMGLLGKKSSDKHSKQT